LYVYIGVTVKNVTNSTKYVNAKVVDWCLFLPSKFLPLFCYSLHNMRDKGVLKRLRLQWWKPQLPKLKSPWCTVDLYSITPILVVLAAGVIMAGILVVLERKWHQHQLTEPNELQQ
jgi:hypothetical protein